MFALTRSRWLTDCARRGAARCRTVSGSLLMATAMLSMALLPSNAAWGGPGASPQAVRRLLRSPQASARAAAVRRLAAGDSRAAWRLVLEVLDDEHPYVRRAAAGVLGVMPCDHERVSRDLRRMRTPRARAAATSGLVQWLDAAGASCLRHWLDDKDPQVRADALIALVRIAQDDPTHDVADWPVPDEAQALLRAALRDASGYVRARALDVLREAWPEVLGVEAWRAAQQDEDPRVRMVALEGSVAAKGDTAVVAVLSGSRDAVWSIRLVAAELAGAVRDQRVLLRLITWLDETRRRRVHDAVHRALVRLTGIPFAADPARWRAWLQEDGASFDLGKVGDDVASRFKSRTHTVVKERFMGVPLVSSHVAFVLDGSESMADLGDDGRRRHDVAYEALKGALAGLEVRGQAHFNVHRFATEVESFAHRLLPATPRQAKRALAWMGERAPAGRTALFDGIARALEDEDVDQVIVLSDGAPSAGAWFTKTDLLREVGRRNRFRRARIDVVAIGAQRVAKRWRDVLLRVAKEHGGSYEARP